MDQFTKVVFPTLSLDGQLIPVEGIATEPALSLDRFAGIDYLLLRPDGGLLGLAARVQECQRAFCTFTIRLKTELPKRLRDIANCYLMPSLTIQAYITPTKIISGMIPTTELYRQIRQKHNIPRLKILTNQQDQNKFLTVPWGILNNVTTIRYETDNI